jgi:MFS family permease
VASCLPALVLVLYYNLNLISLYWYYPVHAAIGAFSSTSLTLAAVSDSMPKQNRAAAFGIVISFAYIGFIVGPLLGRVVTTADDALYLSLMLVVLCAVYVLVVLEETLPCKVRRPRLPASHIHSASPVGPYARHVGWLCEEKKKQSPDDTTRGCAGGGPTAGIASADRRHARGAAASVG